MIMCLDAADVKALGGIFAKLGAAVDAGTLPDGGAERLSALRTAYA